ncbi:cell division protein FtsW [Clostridia bacterium]|nr:cell division protein FtsW [Clostridia bacterium]
MFDFGIIVSRYLFLFLIAAFLYNTIVSMLAEERTVNPDALRAAVLNSRLIVLYMHCLGIFILIYKSRFDLKIIGVSLASLVFLIIYNKFAGTKKPSLINCVSFLASVGFIVLIRLSPNYALRQIVFAFAGFAVSLVVPWLIVRLKFSAVYAVLSGILLVSPLLIGRTVSGATNWIIFNVHSISLSIQPSEFAKIMYVLYMAASSKHFKNIKKMNLRQVLKNTNTLLPLIVSAAFILILVLERDLGGALVFFVTFLVMFYAATGSLRVVGFSLLLLCVGGFASYKIFGHVQARVDSWLNPWADISDSGYQVTQSLFAIGTWGGMGSGLTRGLPQLIPIAESDFVFSAMCEEFGVLFGIGVILVYLAMIHKIFFAPQKDNIANIGFGAMLAFQAFLIIGGNCSLLPLTGVTLPFLSYGGSSLVASFIIIGIICITSKTEEESEEVEL